MDLAVVRFSGVGSAAKAFAAARGAGAPWTHEVGLVEHHHNGHLVLRGTFAGHYIDVDEALHVSQRGTVEGFASGAVVGVLAGPPGLAAGMVLGAVLGSQVGKPSEFDAEPQPLVDRLRATVPLSGSALFLVAEPGDVNAMLAAVGDSDGEVVRQTLTRGQAAALQTSLVTAPAASRGPSRFGEEARDSAI
jgi:uncharacterized membrane protein